MAKKKYRNKSTKTTMGLANTTPNAAKALTESNKSREVIAEMTVPLIGKPIGKGSTANPASKLDPESDHPVIKRAIKIGILPERIALFTDITELERQCQLIKPQSTAKAGKKKKKKQVIRGGYIIKGEPTIIKCTIEMTEARAQHVARCTYDEGQLGDFLRHERIDPRCVNNLTFNRCCVPKRGMLVTVVTIDYMKE